MITYDELIEVDYQEPDDFNAEWIPLEVELSLMDEYSDYQEIMSGY